MDGDMGSWKPAATDVASNYRDRKEVLRSTIAHRLIVRSGTAQIEKVIGSARGRRSPAFSA